MKLRRPNSGLIVATIALVIAMSSRQPSPIPKAP